MKYLIFIGAMMLNAITIHAQNENSIRKLVRYLSERHPEGCSYSLTRGKDKLFEHCFFDQGYDITKQNNMDCYQHQMLKDTLMQSFLDASADAVACHHRKTSYGTDGSIDYALALGAYEGADAKLRESYHSLEFQPAKESASLSYHPEERDCPLSMKYRKETQEQRTTQVLDFEDIRSIIEKIAQEKGAVIYPVSYRYNTQKDKLSPNLTRYISKLDDETHEMIHFEGGDRFGVEEGGCSGTLYLFPKEKVKEVAFALHAEFLNYLYNHLDRQWQFNYIYTGFEKLIVSLNGDNDAEYDAADACPEHIHAQRDKFGRYAIIFIDKVDATFTLPDDYETMLSYDHGKVVYQPDYEVLNAEKQSAATYPSFSLSWFGLTTQQLGLADLPNPRRQEWIGGDSYRKIYTWEWQIDKDSINSIRQKLINNAFSDLKHVESHTEQGDTIELVASDSHRKKDWFTCKMYGKGNTYTAFMQYYIDQKKEDYSIPIPFNTQWVNEYIQQMKESACIEEHEIHYNYGKKSNPASMGKVGGKLYVLTADANTLMNRMLGYVKEHKNQTFHIVEEYKGSSRLIRITDRILARFDSSKKEFQLLCIDHVDGKYLIPEEWYRITDYQYGKKKYLRTH